MVSVNVASKSAEQLSASSVTSPVIKTSDKFVSHSRDTSAGTVNVGAVVSCTVIVCIAVVVLSHSSVNTHVLVITVSLAQDPSAMVSVNIASKSAEQLSASSVTSPVIETSDKSVSQSRDTSAGTVNVGAVVSSTEIFCECEIWFPQLSVAVHVLIIV